MQLVVHFKDGAPLVVPVSVSHTVQVIGPVGGVQDAFSFDGVTDVGFVFNEQAPVANVPAEAPAPAEAAPSAQDTADHDQAVSDVIETMVGARDAITADAQAEALAKAKQDLAVALAQWPDSPELLDLQAKLDELDG